MKIKKIEAYEIISSRGNPTIEVRVVLQNSIEAKASVPSGASTGSKESVELRDGDKKRYHGKGVLQACKNVNERIFPVVKKIHVDDQVDIDNAMLELDGTGNKSELGANSILAVSLACARAASEHLGLPLWQYLKKTYGLDHSPLKGLPAPLLNLINGGAHADSALDIQEFFAVPSGVKTFGEQMRAGSEIFNSLGKILIEKKYRISVGNEGGFAPRLKSNEEALSLINKAIKKAGYEAGKEVFTGVDAAASEFFDREKETYDFKLDKREMKNEEVVNLFNEWIGKHNMEVIEDPMSEFDWEGWGLFNKELGNKAIVVGDDLTVTNRKIVSEASLRGACNGVIIKPNQIGSLTETMDCIKIAQEHEMKVIVSHRSGDTTDDFVADLAVAAGADYVKFGAPSRGERVCKYNRLMEIERNAR